MSIKNFHNKILKRICNGFIKITEGQLTKCYGNTNEQFIVHIFHEPDTMRLTEFIFVKINLNAENKIVKVLPKKFMDNFEDDLKSMLK
jgi:hypothetical protein